MHPSDIQTRLEQIGTRADPDVPVIETLLLIGALNSVEEIDLDPYRAHIKELHHALDLEIEKKPAPSENILEYRINLLRSILVDEFGYHGEEFDDYYSDPDKTNMLDVIDRRSGISVAIGALYLDLAEKRKWKAFGLNFPKHFLFQLEEGPKRRIVDPFYPKDEMDAGKMRQLAKAVIGPAAELSHDYYTDVSHREIILRFCNHRKTRLIAQEDYTRAMQMLTQELWVAPHEPRLYFDAGMIAIRMDRLPQAVTYLEKYVKISKDSKTSKEAQTLIRSLQRQLS